MIEKPMKTLAVGEIKYIITDAEAREDIGELQTNVTNINNHVTETDAEISDLKSATKKLVSPHHPAKTSRDTMSCRVRTCVAFS